MSSPRVLFIILLALSRASGAAVADPPLSACRQVDSTARTLAEIRAAERRRIPLEVQLKSADNYPAGGPVNVTIIVTNLFDAPLIMNSRMLVNHPLLKGEVSFRIVAEDGTRVDIQ